MNSLRKQGAWRLLMHEVRSEDKSLSPKRRMEVEYPVFDDVPQLDDIGDQFELSDLDVGDTPRSGAGPVPYPVWKYNQDVVLDHALLLVLILVAFSRAFLDQTA